ncbi:unnamed protein product [Prorocentrum cordatum]|uniref:Fe2OG dioxygenase domain-containing protein n=1 Tax=Prorocentrum cordatum TaxID=2364126 RepID=A0ABN9VKU7_9DINO|nr:unnamed protein product [Polarella glacialis]
MAWFTESTAQSFSLTVLSGLETDKLSCPRAFFFEVFADAAADVDAGCAARLTPETSSEVESELAELVLTSPQLVELSGVLLALALMLAESLIVALHVEARTATKKIAASSCPQCPGRTAEVRFQFKRRTSLIFALGGALRAAPGGVGPIFGVARRRSRASAGVDGAALPARELPRKAAQKVARKVCLRLAGLPSALLAAAAACGSSGDEGGPVEAPRLRLHPHVMAATYRRGAEYHCHKDSYHGKDNLRMLTILLYLNRDWRPGDDGELRLFAQRPGEDAADESRFVDVAPRCGRLVMFRSREVWHAVREPREERWALTLWVMAE